MLLAAGLLVLNLAAPAADQILLDTQVTQLFRAQWLAFREIKVFEVLVIV
jgi:hypothetical protein